MDVNHSLLCSLGVSHPSLDAAVAAAAGRGVHAKMTGAGGGGFAFALLTPRCSRAANGLAAELAEKGFDCWETPIGGDGVRVEK